MKDQENTSREIYVSTDNPLRKFVQRLFDDWFEEGIFDSVIKEKYWKEKCIKNIEEELYPNDKYEQILELLDIHKQFFEQKEYYHYFKGICYSNLYYKKIKEISGDNHLPIPYKELPSEYALALKAFKQALENAPSDDEVFISELRMVLADLYCSVNNYLDEYRNLIGMWNGTDLKESPEIVKTRLAITRDLKDSTSALNKYLLEEVDYSQRQFIFVASDEETVSGCYDDGIGCYFPIKSLPAIAQFPFGHPQPNTLYYAHPIKTWYYMPFEEADQLLFDEKVREFYHLCQCLGATEISFKSLKGRSLESATSSQLNVDAGGEYKCFEVQGGYNNQREQINHTTEHRQKEMVLRFNPAQSPYVPDNTTWLSITPDWQSLVKMRLGGGLTHYTIRISSRKTMSVSDSRLDSVKLAFNAVVAKINGTISQHILRSFQREDETEWEFNVTFNSQADFGKTEQLKIVSNEAEKEYIDSLKDFLEDDAEITPHERKMLDRIRQSLGISKERAAELEASLKPQLTEDEQDYLDMYHEYATKGEITEKERRRLEKFAGALNIPSNRIIELENL